MLLGYRRASTEDRRSPCNARRSKPPGVNVSTKRFTRSTLCRALAPG